MIEQNASVMTVLKGSMLTSIMKCSNVRMEIMIKTILRQIITQCAGTQDIFKKLASCDPYGRKSGLRTVAFLLRLSIFYITPVMLDISCTTFLYRIVLAGFQLLSIFTRGVENSLDPLDGHSSSSSILPTLLAFRHLLQVQRAAVLSHFLLNLTN